MPKMRLALLKMCSYGSILIDIKYFTWSWPSLLAARCEKMSRISAVRSQRRILGPSARSNARSWPGLSSSSNITVSASAASSAVCNSSSLPLRNSKSCDQKSAEIHQALAKARAKARQSSLCPPQLHPARSVIPATCRCMMGTCYRQAANTLSLSS